MTILLLTSCQPVGPDHASIGPDEACVQRSAIGPIDLADGISVDGVKINDDGAIALRRFVPPWTPFTVTGFNVIPVSSYGPCSEMDGEVIWFTGPSVAPATDPADWHEVDYDASAMVWDPDVGGLMDKSGVFTTLSPGVVLQTGEAFWAGVRLHTVDHGDSRSCVQSCKSSPHDPEDTWYTDSLPDGATSPCPGPQCAWARLADSPTPALAAMFGSGAHDYMFRAFGH